ncbi:dTMP kinase [Bradyrhizobium ganzhouense]|uniref:dTMP kinase n=1 Tax=Bradyrhizobium ganzhouense TaxID=1179767 RepID=UPI003CFB2D37
MTDDMLVSREWLPIAALDGPSGVGKTTLLEGIADRLRRSAVRMELASNNDSGRWRQVIRELAGSPEHPLTLALSTASARAELREAARGPVLCDRYVLSTLVYQRFAGISMDYLYVVNRPLLAGSVTFALRLEAEELAERRKSRAHKSDWFKDRLDVRREVEMYEEASTYLVQKGHDVRIVDASMDKVAIVEGLSVELASLWAKFRRS